MIQSLLGIILFPVLAFLCSENRQGVRWRLVAGSLLLQFFLAGILLHLPGIKTIFSLLNLMVGAVEGAAGDGAAFMFGYLGGAPPPFSLDGPGENFIIAFRVLPVVLLMSSLFSLFYHFGLLQFFVRHLSHLLQRSLGIGGVRGLSVAVSVFLGIVEAPLSVRPYLAGMSRATLFTMMTAAMATVAGTVMILYASLLRNVLPDALGHIMIASLLSAPAAVLFAHLLIPGDPDETGEDRDPELPRSDSAFDALVSGAMDGIQLCVTIAGMIVVVFALVSLCNRGLSLLPLIADTPLSLERICSWLFLPVVWLMGIPAVECVTAAKLLASKTILNEFVAYRQLGITVPELLSPPSRVILTYALCGFANLASLGLITATIGTLAPKRRSEAVSLAFRSLLAGTLATCLTGAVIGCLTLH